LFAALEVTSGQVIAQPYRRHRHQEFLRFLKLIDAAVPAGLDLHLICDNYATHKTRAVKTGCCATRASTYTSRPPAHPGSTSSSGGSPN